MRILKWVAVTFGSLVLGLILLIVLIPTSDRKPQPAVSNSVATAPPLQSPAPKPVEIGFDWNAVRNTLRKDYPEAMTAFFDKGIGNVEIETNTRKESSATIWLAKRSDGAAARNLAETFATYILKDRVARGQKPRDEWQFLRIDVKSRDAPPSVTGNAQIVYFGRVTYDFNKDRLEWDAKF